jgi:hypothetical protein
MNKRITITAVALLLMFFTAVAQKPKWIGNTPHELNSSYKFVEVISYGTSVDGARMDAKQQLAMNEQLINAIKVNVESGMKTHEEETIVNGKANAKYKEEVDIKMSTTGETYKLQAYAVDEYNAGRHGGLVKLHTLYMVAVQDKPTFDRTYLTTNYGATPVVMSVIPGLGQWYKGSKVKGICMFGATAAAVAGIIICNNEANTAEKNIKLEPKYAKHYEDKKSNWETGRNICIGAAAAIWIYNMIDAAVAKGARRVEVKPAGRSFVSLTPALNTDYAGFSLSYNF